ncbi:hypothetical protein HYR99_21020 [Candidatus Poribacteria bacterium]|nr:hypothetical protein [Candidatus Poribacteria bacterium]
MLRIKMLPVVVLAVVGLAIAGVFLSGLGNTASAGHKVQINHKPGTPASKVLCVDAGALADHLGHGDTIVDADLDGNADPCGP